MKPTQRSIAQVLITFIGIFAVPVAFTQTGAGQDKSQAVHMPQYDPTSAVVVEGTVEEVQQTTMPAEQRDQAKGTAHSDLRVILKTEDESVTVIVGPPGFVKAKNFTFAKGDEIEVTGSRVKYGDGEAVIARDIKKGNRTLTLRNAKGTPEWSAASKH